MGRVQAKVSVQVDILVGRVFVQMGGLVDILEDKRAGMRHELAHQAVHSRAHQGNNCSQSIPTRKMPSSLNKALWRRFPVFYTF